MIKLYNSNINIVMMRQPPHCAGQQTEGCSQDEPSKTNSIDHIQNVTIIQVWQNNLHTEISKISHLAKKYQVISIDTQFPCIQNVFYCQKNTLLSKEHLHYQKLKKNVDSTDLIQLGLTLSDDQGNVPNNGEGFCWQFNFKYQDDIQQVSPSSAELLQNSGIDFQQLKKKGVTYKRFSQQMLKSGLLFSKSIKWIAFHGCYDFSYLLKLLRNEPLPKSMHDFYKSIKIYFPTKFDIKYMIHSHQQFKRLGLSKLAEKLECSRIGPQHQAGSDSLLTMQCFNRLFTSKQMQRQILVECQNIIFGIGITEKSYQLNLSQFEQHTYLQQNFAGEPNSKIYNQSIGINPNIGGYMGNPLQDFLSHSYSYGYNYPTRSSNKYQ